MKVVIGQEVKYNINELSIMSMRIRKDKNDALDFLIQFQWLDPNGTTIRADVNRYTQAQLATAAGGNDITGIVAALTALIPTDGERQSLFVSMIREPFVFRGLYMTVVEGKNTWNAKTYTPEELTAAGLTIEEFKGATSLLASALTRD